MLAQEQLVGGKIAALLDSNEPRDFYGFYFGCKKLVCEMKPQYWVTAPGIGFIELPGVIGSSSIRQTYAETAQQYICDIDQDWINKVLFKSLVACYDDFMTEYVQRTYDKIAEEYTCEFFDDTSDFPIIEELAVQLRPGARVLDLGSGPGQFAKLLLEKGFVVEGIDFSDNMLAIARERVPNVTFTKMDMRQLRFPDHVFDAVLAAYSIIHIPTEELGGVLSEVHRVLKSDGYALVLAQQGEPDQVLDEPLAKGEKIFVNFFTEERLNGLLTGANFQIVRQGVADQASEDVMSSTVLWMLVSPGRKP